MKTLQYSIQEKLRIGKNIKVPVYTYTFDDFVNKYHLHKASSVENMVVKLPDSFIENPNFKYILDLLNNTHLDIESKKIYKDLNQFIKTDLNLNSYHPEFIVHHNVTNDIDFSIVNFRRDKLGSIYIDLERSRSNITFEWENKEAEQAIIQIIEYIINYTI